MGLWETLGSFIDPLFDIGKSAWDIYAQKKTWEREDNAVQRRVADLNKAGLSPVLAAGSAASTSAPISVNKPTPGADFLRTKEAAANLISMKQNIATSHAQEVLNNMQARKMQPEVAAADALRSMRTPDGKSAYTELGLTMFDNAMAGRDAAKAAARSAFAQADKAETEAERAKWDFDMYKRLGLATALPGGLMGLIVGGQQQGLSLADMTKSELVKKARGNGHVYAHP